MKIIKQIIIFFIFFIMTFVIAEVFIRNAKIANVSSTEFYEDIGRGRRKSIDYAMFNEGFSFGKFNEYRYIGEANPPQKKENIIRIALLGDSYVESFQVLDRHYFGNIAEEILKEKFPNKKIELLNFGRSGFDISDVYAYHKNFVNNFNPDYILYFLSKGDLTPSYSDKLRPKSIIENDSLKIKFDFKKTDVTTFQKTKALTQNSAILNMLNSGRKKLKTIPIQAVLLDKIYTWFAKSENGETVDNKNESKYKINPVTNKIFETIDNTKVIFVNRDDEMQPKEVIELIDNENIVYIDLSTTIQQMINANNDPHYWKVTNKNGHWNYEAHRKIGKKLAQDLEKIIE